MIAYNRYEEGRFKTCFQAIPFTFSLAYMFLGERYPLRLSTRVSYGLLSRVSACCSGVPKTEIDLK